jgi:O-antigen ligase
MASASTVASLLLGTEISGSGRLGGLSNPNTIACIAMIAAVLLLWDLGQGHHWRFWQTVTTVALLLICLLVLIKTGSRASQAGTAIAMVVVAATSPRNVRIGVLGLFGMMLALIVYQGDAGRLSSRLSSRWLDEGLFTTRDYVWDSSIKSWTEEPWFGHGFGVSSIGREWDGSVLASGMVRDGAGYVGFLESVGVCGSIALTIVFAGVLSRTWTLMRHRHFADTKWLTSMKAFGLFLALATQHVGEPWMIGPGSLMNFTFWLSVGAVFGCSQADYSARTASSRAPPLRANVVN